MADDNPFEQARKKQSDAINKSRRAQSDVASRYIKGEISPSIQRLLDKANRLQERRDAAKSSIYPDKKSDPISAEESDRRRFLRETTLG